MSPRMKRPERASRDDSQHASHNRGGDPRLDRVVDARDRGLSINAIAGSEGVTAATVRYYVRKARRLGRLVKIDGTGRHKRPIDRRPSTEVAALLRVPPPAEQPVAVIPLPPELPGSPWRHIEEAQFGWWVKLARADLVPWDPASGGLKNGTRTFTRRYHLLGNVWGTIQLYSNYHAVLHVDKVPVRWADKDAWNDLLYALAMDAQRRLGRDLADLGTSVTQTVPEPIESERTRAARAEGHPRIVTGDIYVPLEGAEGSGRVKVNGYAEVNRSPPGPAAESPSILYQHVLEHLPERVIALEAANARVAASLERIEGSVAALATEMTKLASAQERIAAALERLLAPREPEPAQASKVEKSSGPGDYVR